MNGFDRRRKAKEQSILQTALTLFMHQGIKSTSIQTIAKQAQVSPVTVFNYFGSKEKLLDQTCSLYFDSTYEDFKQVIDSEQSFEEKMQYLIFTKGQVSKDIHADFYEALMLKYSHPDEHMVAFLKKGIILYQVLFEQGKAEGMISKELSMPALMLYMQLLTTSMQDEAIYKDILPFSDEIMNMFLYGIYGKRE
ncbi:TetR/AcrR family transcriptional regulator [Enterococcus sp. BWM-S5]|uniref:TetR/AcrR family transcriptional regulator n=1 Tax=Enterococcus larvae TaxID=2794352 RepID=A0ABS4CJU4_9ENTE|nr:TetR/AcrR family transcriptional regulator [Enterococcus larvae]MBP1046074.1 TetR/AcrR family transcriptional regulator [Enterococcus larvae]